jgi:ribosomal protein S6--L-glutamate ligase
VRILVLSRKRTLYTTRRLVEAARTLGHRPAVLDPMRCWIVCGPREPALHHRAGRKKLRPPDVAIPRIGSAGSDHGLAVVTQLDTMGVPLVNAARAIHRTRDKLRSLQLLSRHDIDIPRTVMARGPGNVGTALDLVGGPPVVLKLIRGTQGVGVMLAETRVALDSILHTLWSVGQNVLIQEYVTESDGRDIRALVLGDRVIAAMRRTARMGDFRSNIHRGGSGEAVDLPPEYERAAVEAARVMGLHLAGVDLLESSTGPKVIEINASPGFEALEQATGIDVARAIVRFAETLASEAVPALRGHR